MKGVIHSDAPSGGYRSPVEPGAGPSRDGASTAEAARHVLPLDLRFGSLVQRCGASFLLQFSETVLLSIVLLMFARVLGADAFGDYAFALTVATVLVMLARGGVDVSAVRFVSQYATRGEFGLLRGYQRFASRMVMATSMVVAVAFALITVVLSARIGSQLTLCLAAAAVLIPFQAMLHVTAALLRGFHHAVRSRVPQGAIAPGVLAIGGGAALILAHGQVDVPAWSLVLLHVAASVVGLSFAVVWLRRVRPVAERLSLPQYELRGWARSAGLLVLLGGLTKLHAEVDVLMLGALIDTGQAGIYAVVYRLAGVPMLLCVAVSVIVAPTMASLAADGQLVRLKRLFGASVGLIVAASLPVAIAIACLGRPILGLAGPHFVAGYAALLVLLVGNVIHNLFGPIGVLLNMAGHEWKTVRVFALSVALNALANGWLIPRYGLIGAASSTAAALLLIQVLLAIEARRALQLPWAGSEWFRWRRSHRAGLGPGASRLTDDRRPEQLEQPVRKAG